MKKPVINRAVSRFCDPDNAATHNVRFPAVLFRNCLYVGYPRHQDAINLAYAKLTEHARRRAQDRIAEGKETMVFGFTRGDGTDWIESDCQKSRIAMYITGF